MRFSSLLFRLIIENLHGEIDTIIGDSPMSVKAAYVQGFLDADGSVEDFGIIINQRASKSGLENLQRLGRILTELGVDHGEIKFTNERKFAYIRIPAQSRATNLKKFRG